jgi:type I restriction-modification system DNA methylase subunit
MNMILHDNPTVLIAQSNTLVDPKFKDGDTLKTFDYVIANSPFSDKRWSTGLDPLNDPCQAGTKATLQSGRRKPPRKPPNSREIRNSTSAITNTILAMPTAAKAIPPNPRTPAISAMTRRVTTRPNIFFSPES